LMAFHDAPGKCLLQAVLFCFLLVEGCWRTSGTSGWRSLVVTIVSLIFHFPAIPIGNVNWWLGEIGRWKEKGKRIKGASELWTLLGPWWWVVESGIECNSLVTEKEGSSCLLFCSILNKEHSCPFSTDCVVNVSGLVWNWLWMPVVFYVPLSASQHCWWWAIPGMTLGKNWTTGSMWE
jgi:hypothetical protein